MVITRVKNGSPDMIPTAFDGKFDEKQDEIPPGICRPHLLQNIHIGNLRVAIKHKNDHNSDPWGSPMARIWHARYYHPVKYFGTPKGPKF